MINSDTIAVTRHLLAAIAEIEEFKGAWRALGTLAPERLAALRRVATIESIGSSTRIEGSKLSDRDVERLLSGLEIKPFASRDEQEVAGYAEAMELVFRAWEDIAVTENHIRQLHRDLSESVREHCQRLQSLRSMRRMEDRRRNASAFRVRFSQSFASRRQRLSHAKVRSAIQRLGRTTKPLTKADRRTISTLTCNRSHPQFSRGLGEGDG